MNLDLLITLGYYISSIGFLAAAIIAYMAASKAQQSGIKTVLSYIFIGTAIFFAITVFQKLGAGFFGIADDSVDIWWHIMFYLAMFSYYFAFKKLSSLGSSDQTGIATKDNTKAWGIFSLIVMILCFVLPHMVDSWIIAYNGSKLSELGAHHFLAFVMAGVVGAYLLSAKIFLGQIGKAIATPMIFAVWALALQHFWELLVESWKVIIVTPEVGEGVEKIFLVIAAICVIYSVERLKALSKA